MLKRILLLGVLVLALDVAAQGVPSVASATAQNPALNLATKPAAQGIKWLAGDLPPFIWQQSDGPHGYAYDLVLAMSAKMGRTAEVNFMPWVRAVKTTETGTQYGVFPLARTPDREANFKWLVKLLNVQYTFFGRHGAGGKGREHNLSTLAQLQFKKIGVLRGSPIINNLRENGFINIVDGRDYQELLKFLASGQIDAIYAGRPMMIAAIEQSGVDLKEFKVGTSLGEADLYMGASLTLDPHEEARLLAAYNAIVNDGTVARLQKFYFDKKLR